MQWLCVFRPVSQVPTVESVLGKPRRPEIELSALNQSGLAVKEFIEGGGTRVEFALDSPFIERQAAEPRRNAQTRGGEPRSGRRGQDQDHVATYTSTVTYANNRYPFTRVVAYLP